jgi:hypothetical protein
VPVTAITQHRRRVYGRHHDGLRRYVHVHL